MHCSRDVVLGALLALAGGLAPAGAASVRDALDADELYFSEEVQRRVAEIEGRARAATGRTTGAEARRVEQGAAEVEQVIRESVSTSRGPERLTTAQIDEEVARIVQEELARVGIATPLAPPPGGPRIPDVVVGQALFGFERQVFGSAETTPSTTETIYQSYQLTVRGLPHPRTEAAVVSTIYRSNLRQANILQTSLDHRFDRRWSGTIIFTLDQERFKPDPPIQDFFLDNIQVNLALALPDDLKIEQRITQERKDFEFDTVLTPSHILYVGDWGIEKRVGEGLVRLGNRVTTQDFVQSPTSNFHRLVQTLRYAAPVARKVDLDYQLTREKENPNLDPRDLGDYVQNTNRLSTNVRFSFMQSLLVDVEYEARGYAQPDPSFVSYRRTLLAPTYTLVQTPHSSYSLGYSEEVYRHEDFDPTGVFLGRDLDYRDIRYTATASFQKKRMFATVSYALGSRRYIQFQSETQSNFDTQDATLAAQYTFSPRAQATLSLARSTQDYSLSPASSSIASSLSLVGLIRL